MVFPEWNSGTNPRSSKLYPLSLIKDGEHHRFFPSSAEFLIVAQQLSVVWGRDERTHYPRESAEVPPRLSRTRRADSDLAAGQLTE